MGWQVAALIVSGVSAVSQAKIASKAAAATAEAANTSARFAIDEATRQQEAVNEQARQEKSDRIREAEAELARARSASAEGFGMLYREVAEIGYLEGLDLSRIESNRKAQVDSLQSRKAAAAHDAKTAGENAARSAKAATQGAVLNFLGTAAMIKAKGAANTKVEEGAKRQVGIAYSPYRSS